MSIKYFCDLCPSELDENGGHAAFENRKLTVQKRFDLCRFCYARLIAMFGEPKKLKREGLPDE